MFKENLKGKDTNMYFKLNKYRRRSFIGIDVIASSQIKIRYTNRFNYLNVFHANYIYKLNVCKDFYLIPKRPNTKSAKINNYNLSLDSRDLNNV